MKMWNLLAGSGKSFWTKRPAFKPVTSSFLRSAEYNELMSRHLPFPGQYDIHEAQNQTQNFLYRHHQVNHLLGAFRWRGMQKHLDIVLDLFQGKGNRVLDFGGAASPLGMDAEVVDFLTKDAFGHDVPFQNLNEVDGPVNAIFTSHTLEHIPQLDEVLEEMRSLLRPGGMLLAQVPSFYCERWRAGIHKNKTHNDHRWTFGLSGSVLPDGLLHYRPIDEVIDTHFNIQLAEYCGDDSIFVVAQK